MSANLCDNCIINQFCQREMIGKTIIDECQKLSYKDRIIYADKNNLIPQLAKTFATIFWDYQDIFGIYLSIKIIKDTFENPRKSFPDMRIEAVKDQMFIELLMKFCKLAEDLGGLLSSRNDNIFKFAQNFNTFNVSSVVNFYQNLKIEDNELSEIFFYPKIDRQKSEKSKAMLKMSYEDLKSNLKVIKENYLKYREVYNSYKHGYRIRFNDSEFMTMDKTGKNIEKVYEKNLMYYNSKQLKENPFTVSIIAYEKYNDLIFEGIYDACLAIIQLIQVFMHNYKKFQKRKNQNVIQLFFDPCMKDFLDTLPKDVVLDY